VVFDDVTFFAVHGLFADAQIGAKLGASQSFGEDARDLNAGGAKAHGSRCLRFRFCSARPNNMHGHAGTQIGNSVADKLRRDVVAVARGIDGGANLHYTG
jgi:hypothetical protein